MEDFSWVEDGVLLFDHYDIESQNLHSSFILAGYNCLAVVINEDGYLPENVISVYGYYLGDYSHKEGTSGIPKFFNQITVPDYWEISSSFHGGEIHDLNHLRGRIRYSLPTNKRYVLAVDWLDEHEIPKVTDCYNQFGEIYARTIYDVNGVRFSKTFYDVTGVEKIVVNYVTGDIILNDNDKTYIFKSETEFVVKFLEDRNLSNQRIFYNSLSTPFFVSEAMPKTADGKRDILFWQEPARPDIPGNMLGILNGTANRTENIMVQKRRSYRQLIKLGANANVLHKLGYIYPFQKDNEHKHEALICTNSDQIEHLEHLINSLPTMRFHVAALTEMSSKLMSMSRYDNVTLYPGIKDSAMDELFEKCDYYFDINHQNEIVSAVSEAFLFNLLIFAFEETIHNWDYIADEHIYPSSDVDRMIADVSNVMEYEAAFDSHLSLQQVSAWSEVDYDCLKEM